MKRAAAIVLAMALVVPAWASAEETVPQELQDLSILDRHGAQVPGDIALTNQDGRKVTLSSYLDDGKPVVLVLAYYRCPMLCGLVLNGLADGLKGLAWAAGDQYRLLVVSFDPRDTAASALDKRAGILGEYGRTVGDRGFEFLVGDEANVKRLADAVGFRFRWDKATDQFAHAAGAFVLTSKGQLSRTLYGIDFPVRELRLALLEASQGKLGGAWDQVVLFCFHYDPDARGYVLAANRLMRAGGVATLIILSIVLIRFWRKEPTRPHAEEA